ncbi:MAG: hypothetical protein R2911_24000 [Caldilineaceae bacterium]
MATRRNTLSVALCVAAFVLILAGCTPRPGAGEVAAVAGAGGLVIDLPTLIIDYDNDGKPSYGGVPLAQLTPAADSIILTAGALDALKAANIQHIQINNRTGGLQILVNGRAMPSIQWDDESLAATTGALEMLGAGGPVVEQLLPFVRNAGLGIVARFPRAEGAAEIPFVVANADATDVKLAQAQFLASVGDPPPTINLPVFYASDGAWTINGMNEDEYMAMLPGVPWQALQLPAALVAGATGAGIQQIALQTRPEGIFININDQALPHIGWQNGELANVVALAADAGLTDALASSGLDPETVLPLVKELLPIIQAADVNLIVHFPAP